MPISNTQHIVTGHPFKEWVGRTNDIIDFLANGANFGGNGTPGGSNTEVQFNNSGALGGNNKLTFNKTTGALSIGGELLITGNASVAGNGGLQVSGDSIFLADLEVDGLLNAQSLAIDTNLTFFGNLSYVSLQASVNLVANISFTLPLTDGSDGQVLTTDGNGQLSFTTAGGGDVATNNVAANNISAALTLNVATHALKINGHSGFTGTFEIANTGMFMTIQNGVIMSVLPALPDPLFEWPLDEGSGNVAAASIGSHDYDFALSGTYTWANGGITIGSGGVGQTNGAPGANIELSTVTVYVAAKITAPGIGYSPLFGTTYGSGYKLTLDPMNGGVPTFIFNGDLGHASGTGPIHPDSQWHIYSGSYDGQNVRVFVDEAELYSSDNVSINAVSIATLFLGSYNGAINVLGSLGDVRLFDTGHDANTRAVVINDMRAIMNARQLGQTMTNLPIWITFEGDSIQQAYAAGPVGPAWLALSALTPNTLFGRTFAASSSYVGPVANNDFHNLNNRAVTVDNTLITDAKNILVVMIGTNDLENVNASNALIWLEDNYKPYVAARRAAGWKVVVQTLLPRAAGFEEARQAVNPAIRANNSWYDALADVGADDSVMGAFEAASNTALYADGTHPTNFGYSEYYLPVAAAIQSLL